jgi:galactitol PTS system EIIA component
MPVANLYDANRRFVPFNTACGGAIIEKLRLTMIVLTSLGLSTPEVFIKAFRPNSGGIKVESFKVFCVDIDSVETWEQAIETCFSVLYSNGLVKESFAAACIERERRYPTGLPTNIGVAIPHADTEHVLHPGACVLRLKRPVNFGRIDDPDTFLPVWMVVALAISADESHSTLLARLIRILQNEHFVDDSLRENETWKIEEQWSKLLAD